MIKENLSARQAIALMVVFIFGSSVILGVSTEIKQDSWISLILAIVFALPLIIIYARIIKLCPGEGLYDMASNLFGKITSKIIIILMTWYAIHLGSLVLRNFTEYIEISTLLNTPQLLVGILLMLTVIYITRSGINILGKWSLIVFPAMLFMVIITIFFSIGSIEISNIFPIMSHSLKSIAKSAYSSFSFPFAETVLILTIASHFKKTDSPYKIYLSGFLIGGLILFVVILRNLAVLGPSMMASSYFPSYVAARVIELGDFLARIEGIITINFIFAGLTKIAVCLIAAAKGISKLFSVKNYKDMLIPCSLLIIALSSILYKNAIEMFDFLNFYAVYAIPFQIIIPVIIWIAAERRAKKNKALS